MKTVFALAIGIMLLSGCQTERKTVTRPDPQPHLREYYAAISPDFWRKNIGKAITIRGVAGYRGKIGPCLHTKRGRVDIKGRGWPKNMLEKVLVVTGTVVRGWESQRLTMEQAKRFQHGSVDVGHSHRPWSVGMPFMFDEIEFSVLERMKTNKENNQ